MKSLITGFCLILGLLSVLTGFLIRLGNGDLTSVLQAEILGTGLLSYGWQFGHKPEVEESQQ